MWSRWYLNEGLEVCWRGEVVLLIKLFNAILSGRMPIYWRKSTLVPL